MICETCGASYTGASGCPICKKIAEDGLDWEGRGEFDADPTADAMIIGQLSGDWDEPSVTHGVTANKDGTAMSVVYYAARTPSKMLEGSAVPIAADRGAQLTTAFEDVVLGWIDGTKTVAVLLAESPLPESELSAALIALAERGLVVFNRDLVTARDGEDEDDLEETDDFRQISSGSYQEVTERETSGSEPERSAAVFDWSDDETTGEEVTHDVPDFSADSLEPTDEEEETKEESPYVPSSPAPPFSRSSSALDRALDDLVIDDDEEPSLREHPTTSPILRAALAADQVRARARGADRPITSDLVLPEPEPARPIVDEPSHVPLAASWGSVEEEPPVLPLPEDALVAIHVAEPPPLIIDETEDPPPAEARSRLPAPTRAPAESFEAVPDPEVIRTKDQLPAPARTRASDKPGERLYEQALADREAGNVISAFTNIKLAIVFDRQNRDYIKLFDDLARKVEKLTKGETPQARAAQLFERATQAEATNKTDEAISLLEEAISLSKDAIYYNRLGIIIAMRKRELEQGLELIEKAIELAPTNRTYRHNQEKVSKLLRGRLEKSTRMGEHQKRGVFGLFGKKK
jgi:hypothetical protein